MSEPVESARLVNELLREADSEKKPQSPAKPKRNSKEELLHKILGIVEKYELEFSYSDTKLKRMNKVELQKILAAVLEQGVKHDMAKAVGVDPRAHGKVVTLGALRMLHNMAAMGVEKVFNQFGTPMCGYECEGFAECLRDPSVSGSIDECLTEIAAENPEVLEYFDSPYARLALVWSGALLTVIKRKEKLRYSQNRNARRMGPTENIRPNPPSTGGGGGPPLRKVDGGKPPRVPVLRTI